MRIGSGEGSTMRNFMVCSVHLIQSRRLRLVCLLARMKEGRSAFKKLTETSTGRRRLWRPRRRWEDNIRMELKEIGINTRN